MAHFGALCPELAGHLNPMTALGRALARRGHRVTFYLRESGRARVEAAGLEFRPFAVTEYPADAVKGELAQLARLGGIKALRHTVEIIRRRTALCLRDVPDMVRADAVDALLVDQVTAEGATIAQAAGLPFATVCNALALHDGPGVPPFFTTWGYGGGPIRRARNRLAWRVLRRLTRPVVRDVNARRRDLGLPPHRTFQDAHSTALQLSQQPPEFEFPGRQFPAAFRFTGPWVDQGGRPPSAFDFGRLDDRPLIYASMGTLQNGQFGVFQTIAAACAGLGAQVVISLGGGATPDALPKLAGDPIVVGAAPQVELLKRATLCVTHAGLNTALECLSAGVPMVAIPVTNDQPGVAARIAHLGCGAVVPLRRLNVARLRGAVERVLNDRAYRTRIGRISASIAGRDGVGEAARWVEEALCGRPGMLGA